MLVGAVITATSGLLLQASAKLSRTSISKRDFTSRRRSAMISKARMSFSFRAIRLPMCLFPIDPHPITRNLRLRCINLRNPADSVDHLADIPFSHVREYGETDDLLISLFGFWIVALPITKALLIERVQVNGDVVYVCSYAFFVKLYEKVSTTCI